MARTHVRGPILNWADATMTTKKTLTVEGMLDAPATAGNLRPRTASQQAAARRSKVGPVLMALLEASDYLTSKGSEHLADKLLVDERSIGFGGVEER